ncbi:hypothetical protein AJ78_02887 [Emergomyces pasteurianus Ep9510]|uniref:Cell wall protein n=1 Tax=Emergomyces pasteurianus Ep9510 TaxID=1447872 RepID=A0A1J9PLM5_9EURO|nr:hypothetical protein AJ78_02887 [Emergomyces pasteurianus Ep9510]
MKITTPLLTLGLALGVVSESIPVKRDLRAFLDVLEEIGNAVDGWKGGLQSGQKDVILDGGEKVLDAVNAGIDAVNAQPPLGPQEALQLTLPVQSLTQKVQQLMELLAQFKGQMEQLGIGPQIKDLLERQLDASNGLADAMSRHVPDSLQALAKSLASAMSKAIQQGLDAYKDVHPATTTSTATSTATMVHPTTTSTHSGNTTHTTGPTVHPDTVPTSTSCVPEPSPSCPPPCEPSPSCPPPCEPNPSCPPPPPCVSPTGGVTPPPHVGPDYKPDHKPDYKPENKPDYNPDHKPDYNPDHNGGNPSPTPTPPMEFPGAAPVNRHSIAGIFAAAAVAVLAF